MPLFEIGYRRIGHGEPTFIIAEIGSNHNRDFRLALQLIDAAAESGADAVKFQLFRAESLYPRNVGVVETPAGPADFFELLKQCELPVEWLPDLKRRAEEQGLLFLCTPFDEASAEALNAVGVDGLKIASPELCHLPLLRRVAGFGKPMILSTGLSTIEDIEEAVQTCRQVNPAVPLALLHCVSAYPAPLSDCNLNIIETLRKHFDLVVGFSDHTLDPELAPTVAVAKGALIIEKHFTLSRSLPGPDHPFALEAEQFAQMVQAVRQVEESAVEYRLNFLTEKYGQKVKIVLGCSTKTIAESEKALYPHDRRSIHSIADIRAGEVFTKWNVAILRGERNLRVGLHPRYFDRILGKRARRDVPYGQGVRWEDVENAR